MHANACTHTHACKHVHVHAHTHTHTHTHTYIHECMFRDLVEEKGCNFAHIKESDLIIVAKGMSEF